jgi:HNH endonuclease
MTRKEARSRLLFDLLARDLSRVNPAISGEFWCPLCTRRFNAGAITRKELSVEHVIPSALGGTVETLTCKSCNNRHGRGMEGQLVNAIRRLDTLDGNGPLPGVFHSDRGSVAVNFLLSESGMIDIRIVGKASHPAGIQAMRNLTAPGSTLNFTLNFGFIPQEYWRAVIRMAYLATFDSLGYWRCKPKPRKFLISFDISLIAGF